MTNEKILRTIKNNAPNLRKIVVFPEDVDFYFNDYEQPSSARAFYWGSRTRRALQLAFHLPIGTYEV